ncbi:tRNA (adenosine(37)-N6)-threonylcarbamoyltransferase complex ATPase subunit type 1 TsaE [Arthrobacter sp. VKM Ac-2550]|uniref:tRNA (adenosine(37)-N6)-threonylcarbamoyltransferase complex ATPase subunit type 1 TsaE n=1 Tax=Crystallibacter permensis TaxID=1938888 RepID=UPI002226DFB6|nr:tRNA (adenosine(37)-N6)-threonylcarbamoyltransferase complex ATPase subunit type 1 TsaE [Arthrobacter sp. VKM Ac-2550]
MWEAEYSVASAEETQALAARIGAQLQSGDLIVLTGELGAGKTTFTQGLGEGLGVRPGIISPTFVLVRVHPSLGDGPDLVHVDAYRLESAGEIDDIDLENTMDSAVTVVEWGRDRVEHLAESRLDITLVRDTGADLAAGGVEAAVEACGSGAETAAEAGGSPAVVLDFDEPDDAEDRQIRITAYGPRWACVNPF